MVRRGIVVPEYEDVIEDTKEPVEESSQKGKPQDSILDEISPKDDSEKELIEKAVTN